MSDLLDIFDANLAMTLGSMGTLYFTVKTYMERAKADKAGIAMKQIDENALAEMSNDSRTDYNIRVERCVLEDGKNEESVKNFTLDFLGAKNKKTFTLDKIKNFPCEEIVAEQVLGSGETSSFHLIDISSRDIFAVFVVVKIIYGSRERYYLYYYADRKNIESSELIPKTVKNKLHPYNKWVKIYSF